MEDKPTQNLKVFCLVSGNLSRAETKVLTFMIFNQGVSFLVFLDNNLELQPVANVEKIQRETDLSYFKLLLVTL